MGCRVQGVGCKVKPGRAGMPGCDDEGFVRLLYKSYFTIVALQELLYNSCLTRVALQELLYMIS